jgi:hypothetical protein
MTGTCTRRFEAAPNVLVQNLDGESVLLNLDSGRYFGLDHMGSRIWTVLSASASVEEAYATLLAEYEVEPERLRRDLDELLANLVTHGLAHVRAE